MSEDPTDIDDILAAIRRCSSGVAPKVTLDTEEARTLLQHVSSWRSNAPRRKERDPDDPPEREARRYARLLRDQLDVVLAMAQTVGPVARQASELRETLAQTITDTRALLAAAKEKK